MVSQSFLQHNLLCLRQTLYAGRLKLFDEASEIFKHTVFQLFVVGVNRSGGRKMEVGWF